MDQTFQLLCLFLKCYMIYFSLTLNLCLVKSELQHERYALAVYTCRYKHRNKTRLASENTRFYSHPSGKQ